MKKIVTHSIIKKRVYAVLITALVSALTAPIAHAYLRTSGGASFDTGTPTPTVQITAPITLTITTTGPAFYLVFDEWVINDGTPTAVSSTPTGQMLTYTLAGTGGSTSLSSLVDNYGSTVGSITANDGYFALSGSLSVTAGQTLVIQPGSFTFASNSGFNPNTPFAFAGNIYLANAGFTALTAPTSVGQVPEPSTWAALLASGGLLGFILRRRIPVGE